MPEYQGESLPKEVGKSLPGKKNQFSLRGSIISLIILLPIIAVLVSTLFWFAIDKPYGDSDNENVIFLVSRGMGFGQMAENLESAGLIADADYFIIRYRIASRLGLLGPHLAGRYSLKPGLKPSRILKILTSHVDAHRIYTTITIPPGSTSSRIAEIVETSALSSQRDIIDSIQSLAVEYPILLTEEGLQGYLYPDTYKFEEPIDLLEVSSKQSADMIVRTMANKFFSVLDDIAPSWSKLTTQQLHEKIILASIVEREYRVNDEAKLIASVFNNRISEGIALESCATVVYTIEETDVGNVYKDQYLLYNRRIFFRYLEIESPYNTYWNSGLPPGPISNPGLIALESAFYPAQSDALFFVVKDPSKGTHVFSRNYSDHLDARTAYLNQFVVKD